jgi:hypothetical protein
MVVIKAPGPAMNPHWWSKERCSRLKLADPVAYQTDVLAEFADAEESLFPSNLIVQSTRRGLRDLPHTPGNSYAAAIDPATRGNAWTLVVATRQGDRKVIATARQWQGSSMEPLRPREVLEEIAGILRNYELDWCYTDQFAADALRDIAGDSGLTLSVEDWTAKEKVRLFNNLATQMADGCVELPPDEQLAKDLKVVKRRATQNGVTIVLPKTSDGRHADYAPALARVLSKWLDDYEKPVPNVGSPEYTSWLVDELERRELEEFEQEQNRPWWDSGATM